MVLMLVVTCDVIAAERYLVKAQFYHLGELVGKPVMEVEEGQTSAAEFSEEGKAQYKFVVLVRPVADGQVYVSMQFSSGKLDIQPNLMADVGKHCVIGAGAVVTKPIPDYAIAVGAPAKVVRDRRQNHASDTDGESAATRTETPVLEPQSAESQ